MAVKNISTGLTAPVHLLTRLLLPGLLLCLAGCTGSVQTQYPEWVSPHFRDHSLAGKIYAVKASEFISKDTLIENVSNTEVILIGEKHENSDHYTIQANLIRTLSELIPRLHVVSESCTRSETDAVLKALNRTYLEPASLPLSKNQLTMLPVFQAVHDTRITFYCGDVDREVMSKAMDHKLEQHEANEERELLSQVLLEKKVEGRIAEMIQQAHCNVLPLEAINPFIELQRLRDASLAYAPDPLAPAIILTGSVHARKDIGIPRYLAQLGRTNYVSVALIEVDSEKQSAEEYLPEYLGAGNGPVFDYLIFTPAHTITDPCEQFAEAIHRMKKERREEESSRNE